ncbi:uncharacterized protein LOC101861739 [Aplysia californica]|uniref:Uncharacterized protein LOC101861739 n=1 Tax=Aplysia californica TaxID=6500 RepID=A0ABM1A2V2_APLCA|nr:uncharacterized protein LOC101861739 [Aplysia californica]
MVPGFVMYTMTLCVLSLVLIFALICNIDAHVRFVCPKPATSKSDVEFNRAFPITDTSSDGSVADDATRAAAAVFDDSLSVSGEDLCGVSGGLDNAPVTDVRPGMLTVQFEETKFLTDAPFRLALLQRSSVTEQHDNDTDVLSTWQSCLLLDHIPHNAHAVVSQKCAENANSELAGTCTESSYHLTIKVPDVDCEDCILLLQQVRVPTGGQVCELNAQHNNSLQCSVYHSCARVSLRATAFGQGRDLSYCSNYLDNLPGDWPYRPQDIYKTEDGATLRMDLVHTTLHLHVPQDSKLGQLERVEVRDNSTVLWNSTVDSGQRAPDAVSVTWTGLTGAQMDALRGGQLILNVVGAKESQAADILFSKQHFPTGSMSSLHDWYTLGGWLHAPVLRGVTDDHPELATTVDDPVVVAPVGPCGTSARFFMAILESVHMTAHGIVGLSIQGTRAYISAVLHVEREIVKSLVFKGPDLVDIPDLVLEVPDNFDGTLQVVRDISEQLPFLDSVGFLKSVEVNSDREHAVLEGDLEEGLFTELRDESGKVGGLGAFQHTQGKWLRAQLVVVDSAPQIQLAQMVGPQGVLLDFSRDTVHCSATACCIDTYVQELTSDMLLYQSVGWIHFLLSTQASNMTGLIIKEAGF